MSQAHTIWVMEQPDWDVDAIRADIMRTHDEVTDQPHRCPACGQKLGFYRQAPPFTLECDGSKGGLADFSPVSAQDAFISTALLEAIRSIGITGWKYLAEAKIVKGRPKKHILKDPVRHYIEISYTDTIRIDEQASEVARSIPIRCFYCTKGYGGFRRLKFKQPLPASTPDMFRCYNLHAAMFCSEKFRRLFIDGKFTGMTFHDPAKFRDWKRDSFIGNDVNMKTITGDQQEYLRQERARFPTDADADKFFFGEDEED